MKQKRVKELMANFGMPQNSQLKILIQQVANEVEQAVRKELTVPLTPQDEMQIILFEEYIEAIADRRINNHAYPDSPDNDTVIVEEARDTFLQEMFKEIDK